MWERMNTLKEEIDVLKSIINEKNNDDNINNNDNIEDYVAINSKINSLFSLSCMFF